MEKEKKIEKTKEEKEADNLYSKAESIYTRKLYIGNKLEDAADAFEKAGKKIKKIKKKGIALQLIKNYEKAGLAFQKAGDCHKKLNANKRSAANSYEKAFKCYDLCDKSKATQMLLEASLSLQNNGDFASAAKFEGTPIKR
jgi:tetratricopeptide (TPR) repeat protein